MRGKLRDKRTETKRESVKRELVERRRISKRENRNIAWQYLQADQEEEYIALRSSAPLMAAGPAPIGRRHKRSRARRQDEQEAFSVPGDV